MMQEPIFETRNESTNQNSGSSVNRRFAVEDLNDSLHAHTVARALTQQPGVRGITLDLQHDCIHVRYDNALIGVETVVEALRNAGYPPRQRFLDRLKYGWWRYLDENARDNATSSSGPCCSNPATLHARQHRRR